ncbi:MAG: M48 family metallopeptidase [Bacteroidales bacterium]|nr:M48 family metallopeptidase [Bacteroidales bacterium]
MKKILWFAPLAGLILIACSTVSMTGRKQLNLVSESEILSASLTEYQSYMKTAKVSTDAAATAVVKNVAQRIAAAAEAYLQVTGQEADIQNYAWEFNLTQDAELNAFCMPGGKIVVYQGMLNLIGNGADRDDELAAVIGHEVGHAMAKHGNERASQQLLANVGQQVVGTAVMGQSYQLQQAVAMAYGLGAQYGALLPFSRKQELEADYIGIVLATIAGYDADAAVTLWEKMEAAGGGSTPQFMSTHPSSSSRIKQLKKDIPTVKATYGSAAAAAGLTNSSGSATTTKSSTKTSTKSTTKSSKSTGYKIG